MISQLSRNMLTDTIIFQTAGAKIQSCMICAPGNKFFTVFLIPKLYTGDIAAIAALAKFMNCNQTIIPPFCAITINYRVAYFDKDASRVIR